MELDDVDSLGTAAYPSINVKAELVQITQTQSQTYNQNGCSVSSELKMNQNQVREDIIIKEQCLLQGEGDSQLIKSSSDQEAYIGLSEERDKAHQDNDEDDPFHEDDLNAEQQDDHYTSRHQPSARELDKLKRDHAVNKTSSAVKRRRLISLMVFLLCMGGVVQGILVNGLINVVITTLEKRYGLVSTDSGLIASSYDIASFICLLPVSYLGGRGTGSKPVWISGGIFLMGIGSLLFSLPHFLLEEPRRMSDEGNPAVSFCRQPLTCSEQHYGSSNHLKWVFMAANLLHGAGASPLYTLGVTYIDENVGSKDSAFFLGMFYTMAIVGPALGYAMGGHFLNIHVDFLSFDVDEMPRGQNWVGAWWLGFVFCGFSSILLAFFIFFLPPTLPGIHKPVEDDQVCRSRLPSRGSSFRASYKARPLRQHDYEDDEDFDMAGGAGPLPVGEELINALTLIFTNPTFIFLSLAGSAEGFLMQGLATFLPKMIQNQFSLSESEAAVNVGVVSVVAGGGGTLLGGLLCKKFRLKVPGLLKLVSVTQFVAILSAMGLVVNCAVNRDVRGGQADLDMDKCASDCGCSAAIDYNPICVEGEQYYNPCWAGCTGENSSTGFYINCTCAVPPPLIMHISSPLSGESEDILSADGGETNKNVDLPGFDQIIEIINGEPGLCKTSCALIPIFITSFFFTMLITFMANMPALTATLRCVDPSVRSLALGVQWLLIRLLGTIPGPVAWGKMLDSNCNQWRKGCSGDQNCLSYNNDRVSHMILQLTALCKGLTIFAFIIGMRLYKHQSSASAPSGPSSDDEIVVQQEKPDSTQSQNSS